MAKTAVKNDGAIYVITALVIFGNRLKTPPFFRHKNLTEWEAFHRNYQSKRLPQQIGLITVYLDVLLIDFQESGFINLIALSLISYFTTVENSNPIT